LEAGPERNFAPRQEGKEWRWERGERGGWSLATYSFANMELSGELVALGALSAGHRVVQMP